MNSDKKPMKSSEEDIVENCVRYSLRVINQKISSILIPQKNNNIEIEVLILSRKII